MGSYLYTGLVQFMMSKEQFNNALFTLTGAAESYDGIDQHRADKIVAYIANTIYTKESIATDLAEVIELFNWHVTFNDEGDISDITLDYHYPADEEKLFTLLGPYVTQGSYIELESQSHGNTYQYRYVFTGKRMLEQELHYDAIPWEVEDSSPLSS